MTLVLLNRFGPSYLGRFSIYPVLSLNFKNTSYFSSNPISLKHQYVFFAKGCENQTMRSYHPIHKSAASKVVICPGILFFCWCPFWEQTPWILTIIYDLAYLEFCFFFCRFIDTFPKSMDLSGSGIVYSMELRASVTGGGCFSVYTLLHIRM